MNSLGDKIKTLREERNMTQEELAARVGVHQTKISHCETGARGVSVLLIEKLASALGANFAELVAVAVNDEREREIA